MTRILTHHVPGAGDVVLIVEIGSPGGPRVRRHPRRVDGAEPRTDGDPTPEDESRGPRHCPHLVHERREDLILGVGDAIVSS